MPRQIAINNVIIDNLIRGNNSIVTIIPMNGKTFTSRNSSRISIRIYRYYLDLDSGVEFIRHLLMFNNINRMSST